MKSKEALLSMLYEILTELESGVLKDKSELEQCQRIKLRFLYEILGEDVPCEYWEQIETQAKI